MGRGLLLALNPVPVSALRGGLALSTYTVGPPGVFPGFDLGVLRGVLVPGWAMRLSCVRVGSVSDGVALVVALGTPLEVVDVVVGGVAVAVAYFDALGGVRGFGWAEGLEDQLVD